MRLERNGDGKSIAWPSVGRKEQGAVMRKIARGLISGLAGGSAWLGAMRVFFGPAQAILTNAALQSAKFNAAFSNMPHPRAMETGCSQ